LPHEQQHLWAAAAVAFRKSVGKLPMLLQTGNALLDLAAKCNLRHSPRRMLPTFPSLGVLESIYLSAQAPLHMHIYGRLVLELELEPTSHEAQPKQFLKVNFAHNILLTGGLLWGEPQTDT